MLKLNTSIAGLLDDWHSRCTHLLCLLLWISMKRGHKLREVNFTKMKSFTKMCFLIIPILPSGKEDNVITGPTLLEAALRSFPQERPTLHFMFDELQCFGKKAS